MATYSTRIHGPSAAAPTVTNKVARCRVCGIQWQVRGNKNEDAQGCSFCGADVRAISITSEAATFGDATVYGGPECEN